MTQNITVNNKMTAKSNLLSRPELIQKQYEEYNNQINLINDVFQQSMGHGNKLKQSEEALKRSSYLLKRSIMATFEDKKLKNASELTSKTKSLNPSQMNRKIVDERTPSLITINQNSRLNEESKGFNIMNDLRLIGLPTPDRSSELTSNRKEYNSNGETPPSLLSSVFEQASSEASNNLHKGSNINMKELAFSKSCYKYQPERDVNQIKSHFGESTLKYSADSFNKYS